MMQMFDIFQCIIFILSRIQLFKSLDTHHYCFGCDILNVSYYPFNWLNLLSQIRINWSYDFELINSLFIDKFLEKYPQFIRFPNKMTNTVHFCQSCFNCFHIIIIFIVTFFKWLNFLIVISRSFLNVVDLFKL